MATKDLIDTALYPVLNVEYLDESQLLYEANIRSIHLGQEGGSYKTQANHKLINEHIAKEQSDPLDIDIADEEKDFKETQEIIKKLLTDLENKGVEKQVALHIAVHCVHRLHRYKTFPYIERRTFHLKTLDRAINQIQTSTFDRTLDDTTYMNQTQAENEPREDKGAVSKSSDPIIIIDEEVTKQSTDDRVKVLEKQMNDQNKMIQDLNTTMQDQNRTTQEMMMQVLQKVSTPTPVTNKNVQQQAQTFSTTPAPTRASFLPLQTPAA